MIIFELVVLVVLAGLLALFLARLINERRTMPVPDAEDPELAEGRFTRLGAGTERKIQVRLEPGEHIVRATRLHWIVVAELIVVFAVFLFILSMVVVFPALPVNFGDSSTGGGFKTYTSQTSTTGTKQRSRKQKSSTGSATTPRPTTHTNRPGANSQSGPRSYNIRGLWVLAAFGFVIFIFVRAGPETRQNWLSWPWTVYVLTNLNARKLVLPPGWFPLEDDELFLPIEVIEGASVRRSFTERQFHAGKVTFNSKVQRLPVHGDLLDPIGPIPDPRGFAKVANRLRMARAESLNPSR
jgi:hypothetical protein